MYFINEEDGSRVVEETIAFAFSITSRTSLTPELMALS